MTTNVSIPSADDLCAGFTFPSVDPIIGKPAYKTLARLQTQLIRNATTVSSTLGGGRFGLAGIVEPADVYLLRTGYVFNRPANPGESPNYPIGATQAQRDTVLATWKTNYKEYQTIRRTETLLLGLIETAIEAPYLAGVHTEEHGFGT